MFAVIQAGGAGTRLKSISGDLPKGMVQIEGKPILEWQILNLKASGIKDFLFLISKAGSPISNYFGNGSQFGVNINYIIEEEPLGTAGGLFFAKDIIKDDFILCFGDLMLDIDWVRFANFHKEKGSKITAFAHPNSHPFDSDLLVLDEKEKIVRIDSKTNNRDSYYYSNITNAGIYVCSKEVLDFIESPIKTDFEKTILSRFVENGLAYAYKSSEYVKDCGTPERFVSVKKALQNKIISSKSLLKPQKAIFIDRDGTINKYAGFVTKAEQLELEDAAAQAIKKINDSSFLAICITNQPVLARGEVSLDELKRTFMKLETDLGREGAYLDATYYCPHHPNRGFEGEVPELKIECECRKPKIGMLTKAKERFNIDFSESWFIGDTLVDVKTGLNAGCKTILVTSGDPEPGRRYPEATPHYTCKTLLDAVNLIMTLEEAKE